MEHVLVVGAGLMGRGIVQVCLQAGLRVTMSDISSEQLAAAQATIRAGLAKWATKQGLAAQAAEAAWQRLASAQDLAAAKDADLIIEAVTERKDLKFKLFAQLDELSRPEITLATNTSAISITEIAAQVRDPSRVVGVHFMNPVPLMPLVELIRGQETAAARMEESKQFVDRLGKVWAEAADYPGFISNRIFMAMLNEAYHVVYEGVGSPESVDKVMKLAFNHPMGPLELSDLVGLDTILEVMEVCYAAYRDNRFRPCPLLVRMVKAGRYGRKAGRGFYDYAAK